MSDEGKVAEFTCYHCGSTNARKHGFYDGRQRLDCLDCGRRFTEILIRPERKGGATLNSGLRCYHCGSMETSKAGFSKFNGRQKQRYYCRSCRRMFRENPQKFARTTALPDCWLPAKLPSASHLILELHAVAQNVLKRTPTIFDIAELSKQNRTYSPNVYRAVFGNFREGLRRARLTPDYPKPLDKDKLIGEMRALRKKLGRPPVSADVKAAHKKGKCSSFYSFRKAFGGFRKAVEAAGAGPKKFSRVEMIDVLRRLYIALDRPVKSVEIREHFHAGKGQPSFQALMKEFGTVAEACRVARVKHAYIPRIL